MPLTGRGRGRDERGAVAVMTALLAVALLITAALTVDLGNTWARRGQLQVQADRAATYAAQFLPADDAAERTKVAKAVAYYLACHPVVGQKQLDPAIPACPGDATSSTLDSYAATLLARGQVTVPVRNQVRVVTPKARVEFGFAKVAGFDGTEQQKVATAKVTSPGSLAPMALSLDCLLSPAANLVTTGGVPFGYISTTHNSGSSSATPPVWLNATAANPTNIGVDPSSVPQQLVGTPPTVRVSASGWPDPAPANATVVFGKDTQRFTATGPLVMDTGRNKKRNGTVTVTLPSGVVGLLGAGSWEVKVQSLLAVTTATGTLDVTSSVSTGSFTCGRLTKSPRGGNQANENFVLNLQEGLDHLLTTYPGVAATPPVTRDALLAVAQATQCGSAGVKDTNGVSGTPNCVVTNMSGAYERGFTEGMIGASGRLTCRAARPCRTGRSFTLNGRSINDDRFSDFVRNTSLLTSNTFFNLDTFLDTGTPVVTPTSNLDREIYNSHRFLWVAVISTTGATSAVQAGDYPILTFRPIFIVQDTALTSENLPLLSAGSLVPPATLATALAYLDQVAKLPLGAWTDQRGLLMSGTDLKAVRFMSISPDALPAVPADYVGPESEYLGVGPRIIRLVE